MIYLSCTEEETEFQRSRTATETAANWDLLYDAFSWKAQVRLTEKLRSQKQSEEYRRRKQNDRKGEIKRYGRRRI